MSNKPAPYIVRKTVNDIKLNTIKCMTIGSYFLIFYVGANALRANNMKEVIECVTVYPQGVLVCGLYGGFFSFMNAVHKLPHSYPNSYHDAILTEIRDDLYTYTINEIDKFKRLIK